MGAREPRAYTAAIHATLDHGAPRVDVDEPHEWVDHTPRGFDADLEALHAHAALLRNAGTATPAPRALPAWPARPRPPRAHWATAAVVAGSVLAAGAIGSHALNIADAVFGTPRRPTLVGHKVGPPWNPVTATTGGTSP